MLRTIRTSSFKQANPRKPRYRRRLVTPPSDTSSVDFALRCFNFDKAQVADCLIRLSKLLTAGSFEIEMVAAERVFDKSFSAKLARQARTLRRLAKQLNRMHEQAARARFPGD